MPDSCSARQLFISVCSFKASCLSPLLQCVDLKARVMLEMLSQTENWQLGCNTWSYWGSMSTTCSSSWLQIASHAHDTNCHFSSRSIVHWGGIWYCMTTKRSKTFCCDCSKTCLQHCLLEWIYIFKPSRQNLTWNKTTGKFCERFERITTVEKQ